MEKPQIDIRYVAIKLIRLLYEQGKINKATYDCVMEKYAPHPNASEQTDTHKIPPS